MMLRKILGGNVKNPRQMRMINKLCLKRLQRHNKNNKVLKVSKEQFKNYTLNYDILLNIIQKVQLI